MSGAVYPLEARLRAGYFPLLLRSRWRFWRWFCSEDFGVGVGVSSGVAVAVGVGVGVAVGMRLALVGVKETSLRQDPDWTGNIQYKPKLPVLRKGTGRFG